MDKKTLTILVVVGVVIVAGGIFAGITRWRQAQVARQILNSYGVNGNISNNIVSNSETGNNPQAAFDQTSEAALVGEVSPVLTGDVKPKIESVFGKTKVITYTTGFGGDKNSFVAAFMVPKAVSGSDFTALLKAFTDEGFAVVTNSASGSSGASALLQKENAMMTVAYGGSEESQQITVMYTSAQK